jgi:hypothetical protein
LFVIPEGNLRLTGTTPKADNPSATFAFFLRALCVVKALPLLLPFWFVITTPLLNPAMLFATMPNRQDICGST